MGFLDPKITPPEQQTETIVGRGSSAQATNPFESGTTATPGGEVRPGNPFAPQDYALITSTFEKNATEVPREEYVLVGHYRDVYSTRNFSERVQQQMQYYPGMHQIAPGPAEDPAKTNAEAMGAQRLDYWNTAMDNPDSFMNALRDNEQDFDYQTIFGTDADAKTRAEHMSRMLTQCIPCFGRPLDLGALLPDGNLLEVHGINIMMRTDLLDQIRNLLGPGSYIDICSLLSLLSKMCPADLLAMIILLSQYLAKLNLDIQFNIDFIISLIGPILSPFLNGLSAWLDKWMQLIVGPMLCVIDHINEVILLAQQAKIPFSEADVNIDHHIGLALPAHQNVSLDHTQGAANSNFVGGAAWAAGSAQEFETPDDRKYNPQPPEYPTEEAYLAGGVETPEAWKTDKMSQEERNAIDKRWEELKKENRARYQNQTSTVRNVNTGQFQQNVANGMYSPGDGTRWSNDDTPNSQKADYQIGAEYYPPEKQGMVHGNDWYIDISPLTNSIVQTRNIMQGAIQYVQDLFDYVTQMIYDLLGTDFGWMTNKSKSSRSKSSLIRLIAILKSLLEAVSKNGLECGINTNFDVPQMKFILEEAMGKYTDTKFKVADDGTVEIIPPGMTNIPEARDDSGGEVQEPTSVEVVNMGPGVGDIEVAPPASSQQKPVKSGIIVKSCLKDMTKEQLTEARRWITEYERKS